ncbi:hypothetical protein VaNZ11_001190, partial [Volvox africanus]
RDLLCVQFMFQRTYQGYDVGKLSLGDFCHPDNPDRADWRLPLPPPQEWPPGATYRLCVRERGTKTSRVQRAPAIYLQSNPTCPAQCFPRTLALYMWPLVSQTQRVSRPEPPLKGTTLRQSKIHNQEGDIVSDNGVVKQRNVRGCYPAIDPREDLVTQGRVLNAHKPLRCDRSRKSVQRQHASGAFTVLAIAGRAGQSAEGKRVGFR